MEKIAVIVSTYNGEKYIGEQLESLINQKLNVNKYILEIDIRDDGSQDETPTIINRFCDKYDNINIVEGSGNNLGVKNSFFSLLKSIDADYYFFCDQDDIWHSDKISKFMDRFKQIDNKLPSGVYSDLDLVDQNNNTLNKTMMEIHNWSYQEKRDFPFLFFQTRVTGASFALNKMARDKLIQIPDKQFKNVLMHDSIAALLVSAYNNLYFIPESLVNYRQHGNNVLGANPKEHSRFDINFKIKHYHQLFHDLIIINNITSDLPKKNQIYLDGIINFLNNYSPVGRLNSVIHNYNSLWNHFRFRHTALLILFYR